MALRVVTGFEFGTTAGWATGNAGNKVVDAVVGTPTVTSTTPRSGTYALEVSAAGTEAVAWSTDTLSTSQTRMRAVFSIRFVTSLPAADSIIAFSGIAGTSVEIRFVSSTSKLRVQFEAGGASQDSASTVAADTWYRIEIYHDVNGNPNTLDWWINGTAQTQLSSGIAASTIAEFHLGDRYTGSTYTARYDDVVIYTDTAALSSVLGAHKVVLLSVDPGGTVTLSGTAANFSTFTANGTLAAWNATTARDNIDEIPPTIGASADGWVQDTAATTEYVQMPMTSYTLGGSETVAGARMLVPGWAVSTTGATIGFRSWNGTTETTLFAAADPNFDNSTTVPAWVCKMLTLADINTQGELDALEFRAGFSGDATPDIGIHAIYAELAVVEAVSGDATATPAVVAGTAAVAGPTVNVGSTISPSVVAGSTTISAASAQGGAGTTPTVVAGTASIPTPTATASSTATPTVVAGTTTIPTPTVTVGGDATATPAVVAGATSIPTPTINTGATATPTVVADVATIPTPTVVVGGDATATPAVVAGTTAIATPTVNVGSTLSPATVAGAATIPTPAAQGGAVVTLTTVAGVAAIATPTVTVGATVTPATVMTLVTIPTPTVTALGVAGTGAPLLTSTAVARAGTTTTDVDALLTVTGR